MTVGQKLKLIRRFKSMTSKELGVAIGITEHTAESRIGQYEQDYRVPKDIQLIKIAEALNVSKYALLQKIDNRVINIIQQIFWAEEDIYLITSSYNKNLVANMAKDIIAGSLYNPNGDDSDKIEQEAHILALSFMEFQTMQSHLYNNRISRHTYFEWKIQWPLKVNLLDFLCACQPDVFAKLEDNSYQYKEHIESANLKYDKAENYPVLSEYFDT